MDSPINTSINVSRLWANNGATILKSMANHHRLLILHRLKEREYSVGELEEVVGLSQSALSQHLARLRKDDVVKTRRSAQMIYYYLPDNPARKILDSMCKIFDDEAAEKTSGEI